MSTRSLVFEYTTKGAKAAAKADQKVRNSVKKTGRVANRNGGSVERWMQRSRKAINMLATATVGAVGAILAASPTMRAELSGVRAAFTLFADTIANDLLPDTESFSSGVLDLVQSFRELDKGTRQIIGGLIVLAGFVAVIGLAVGGTAALIAGALAIAVVAWYKLFDAVGALSHLMSMWKNIARGVVALLKGDFSGAAGYAKAAFYDFLRAWREIFKSVAKIVDDVTSRIRSWIVSKFTQAKQRALALVRLLWQGVQNRLTKLRARVAEIVTNIRDTIVRKITNAKNRVLALLSLGREMAQKGKEWIEGLVSGVRDRISNMVDAFRDMASQAAQAFKDKFNELIPSRISIPSVTISIPSILGGGSRRVGGGSLRLPQLDTGGRIASDGLAMLHAGERVMPAAQVRERGPQPTGDSGTTIEEVTIVVQPMGDDPTGTGRSIAREFERELSDRGA